MASSMDATDATPMMGPPSTPATTSRMTACCCLKTYDRNLSNYFKDPFWGIKQCRSMEILRNFSNSTECIVGVGFISFFGGEWNQTQFRSLGPQS